MSTTEQAATEPADKPRERSWLGSRIARGLVEAPAEYRAWRAATEYDDAVAVARENKDQTKLIIAQDRKRDAIAARRRAMAWLASVVVPVLLGGWMWASIVLGALLVLLAMVGRRVAKVPGVLLGQVGVALAVSVGVELVNAILGIHPDVDGGSLMWTPWMLAWPVLAFLAGLVRLIVWVDPDGTIADDLAAMAPAEVEAPDVPPVIEAVTATGALPKDTAALLVQPGIRSGNDGQIWTATVETGGPSAEPLVSGKPRAELAARLGLSSRRILLTVDEDRGSRLHIVGIPGDPWRNPPGHPLLELGPVDTWKPIPFGPDVEGRCC